MISSVISSISSSPKITAAIFLSIGIFSVGFLMGRQFEAGKTHTARAELAALRLEWSEARTKAEQVARSKEQEWAINSRESEIENAKLKKQNDDAIRAAGAAAIRLRDIAEVSGSVPKDTAATCVSRLKAATSALAECGERLRTVGEAADRCEVDRRMLISSWPK